MKTSTKEFWRRIRDQVEAEEPAVFGTVAAETRARKWFRKEVDEKLKKGERLTKAQAFEGSRRAAREGLTRRGFEDRVWKPQYMAEEPAIALVARRRAIGQPTVDDHQPGAVALRFAKQVRPKLGFQDDQQFGTELFETMPHRPRHVEWGEEDSVGDPYESFFSDGSPGRCRNADENGLPREALFELTNQLDG